MNYLDKKIKIIIDLELYRGFIIIFNEIFYIFFLNFKDLNIDNIFRN